MTNMSMSSQRTDGAGRPEPHVPRSRWRYRTIDLVTVALLGVAVGVAFWGWSQLYHVLSALSVFALPPLAGLLSGPWLLGGVLGGLVVRKPGAALATEMVAASVEALLGNGWGYTNLIAGAVQGLGVEIVLAVVLFRRFGPVVASLAAALSAVFGAIYIWISYYADWGWDFKLIYLAMFVVSGVVTAGLFGWGLTRALARTGALDAFGAGRELHDRGSDDPGRRRKR